MVAALQINMLPLAGLSPGVLVEAVAWMVLMWCLSGVVLIHAALWLEPRVSAPCYFLALTCVAVVLSAVVVGTAGGPYLTQFVGIIDTLGVFAHILWEHLLFGGIGVAALRTMQRDARTREILAHAAIAAQEGEARLKAAAARQLRGQVQPERLVRLVEELKRRYDVDLDRGDRLLERITDFLRAAMPSVRTGVSTLTEELATLAAYGRLLQESDGGGPWCLPPGRDVPGLAFPPLILLPAADALSCLGGGVDVRVRQGPGYLDLGLGASGPSPGASLPVTLADRLRASLYGVFNERASIRVGATNICIRLFDTPRTARAKTGPVVPQRSLP